jgi:hypothetical protein
MRSARLPVVVAVLVLPSAVDASDAQVFFGGEPRASLTIGPLFVVGTASPDISAMTVTVAWNVVPASGRPVAQDLHLFWPAERASATAAGDADRELVGYVEGEYAEAGGLMTYGASQRDAHARLASFAAKILKTAKALGLTIPQSLLLRADHVIE